MKPQIQMHEKTCTMLIFLSMGDYEVSDTDKKFPFSHVMAKLKEDNSYLSLVHHP